ncbi:restriction endonuclease [Flavobacterium pectinovorum]|uniref:restriction endonuclease n=1 Tax=Flavobacterium pectinovorum TaxID=29533 RepID=UPI00265ED813|nr:restriction endonuclease [Flavobacterium pectinovorum]WKL47929.1 restriction endonuclease [Flavobacterium pectinovorum]
MKNDGKPLEKTIQLIEETFKDSEHTEIFRNYKINSKTGDKREIDVLVKTIISGYNIWIAIECKDYESKITVEKIDAFNSKCNVITEINRKIFISKNGFQKGAINHAKEYGIELMTAEQLTEDNLKSVPTVYNFKTSLLPEYTNRTITFDSKFIDLHKENEFAFKGLMKCQETNRIFKIDNFFKKALRENQGQIKNLAMVQWSHLDDRTKQDYHLIVKIELHFENYYFEGKDNVKIPIVKGCCDATVHIHTLQSKISGRIIKYADDSIKAKTLNIKIGDNYESEIVITPNDEFNFYLTKDKNFVKLKNLGMYNPFTNELTKKTNKI